MLPSFHRCLGLPRMKHGLIRGRSMSVLGRDGPQRSCAISAIRFYRSAEAAKNGKQSASKSENCSALNLMNRITFFSVERLRWVIGIDQVSLSTSPHRGVDFNKHYFCSHILQRIRDQSFCWMNGRPSGDSAAKADLSATY